MNGIEGGQPMSATFNLQDHGITVHYESGVNTEVRSESPAV
jgi:hypothetical protein